MQVLSLIEASEAVLEEKQWQQQQQHTVPYGVDQWGGGPNSLFSDGAKLFSDPTFFQTQHLVRAKILSDPNLLSPKNLLDPKFLLTQYLFGQKRF